VHRIHREAQIDHNLSADGRITERLHALARIGMTARVGPESGGR
jgi:hypothetical protein